MRTLFISILLLGLAQVSRAQAGDPEIPELILNCDNDSLGLIPLQDLGEEYYYTYKGGLYLDGSNTMPSKHLSRGKKISRAITKLDEFGNPDPENGRIVMIGMGASIASDAYNTFQDSLRLRDWEGTNRCLDIRSVFVGGKDMGDMVDTTGDYWNKFLSRLDDKSIKPEEVQIVWMLLQSDEDTNAVDVYVYNVIEQYKQILATMFTYMPNLEQVFISGIHYTGYTHPSHERYDYLIEPKGYLGNLAIRELIDKQINGDDELDFSGLDKKVPYISWGPNFWADGKNPREIDGLSWTCDAFRDDSTGGGFHLKDEYKHIEGEMLQSFFETNAITSIWFNESLKWAACDDVRLGETSFYPEMQPQLFIYPNPVAAQLSIEIPTTMETTTELYIYNIEGKIIYFEKFDAEYVNEKVFDTRQLPIGLYHVTLNCKGEKISSSFIKQ